MQVSGSVMVGSTWRRRGALIAAGLVLSLSTMAGGCGQPSHEKIDDWAQTKKGPGKLADALNDAELDADLRAHAAQNLIHRDAAAKVLERLASMREEARQPVVAALVPRLWSDARMDAERGVPAPAQIVAKDALFELRALADTDNQRRIDELLIEWLTGGYYSGRAQTGRFLGSQILAAIAHGPNATAASEGIVRRANALLATPPDSAGRRNKVEDDLLLGLAVVGHPDATGLLLDLVEADRIDPTLPERAMAALHTAYIDPDGLFKAADGARGLAPHVRRLLALANGRKYSARIVNDAVELVGAVGAPACFAGLVELIAQPGDAQLRWVGANAALRCGGVEAIIPVAEALPAAAALERAQLEGAIWRSAVAMESRAEVAARARTLLASANPYARVTGIEILNSLGLASSAAADASRVRALVSDRTRLRGWWGEQADAARGERKADPTVGERAEMVAKNLDRLAESGKNQ